MIICTKCGLENEDRARSCAKCGRKLQSGTRECPASANQPEAERDVDVLAPLDQRGGFSLRHTEPWLYLAILFAAVAVSLHRTDLLPLYVAAPFVAVVAWLRKI